jgi:lipopolysaccharide/colanic/teichoic acid biosynthesis glycosyltransferase
MRNRVYVSSWDLFWAVMSPFVALLLRDGTLLAQGDWTAATYYWLFASGFALLSFFILRIQDGMVRNFSVQEALYIAEAVLFTVLMTCAVLFSLTRLDGIPRSMPLIHGFVLGFGLIAARMVFRIVLSDSEEQKYQSRHERIIVIGANRFATNFIQMLKSYAPPSQPVIAVLDGDPAMIGRAIAGVQVMGTPQELEALVTEFAVHGIKTDRVIIAGEVDFLSDAVRREVERACQRQQIEMQFLPRMLGITEWRAPAEVPAAPMQIEAAVPVSSYFWVKRWIDVVGSLVLIVLLSPLFLVAGLLVLLDVGAPVLFWQERVGWRRRAFLIYKFRTLRAPFDSEGNHTLHERKPTAIGLFLRATRLDELPQLLNVLFGDMSLIGPRPLLPEDQPANTSARLSVRPGISGWAQIHGGKLVSKEDKEKLDEWYVRNASLVVDIRIAWKTLKLMLTSRMGGQESLEDANQVKNKGLHMAPGSALAEKVRQ